MTSNVSVVNDTRPEQLRCITALFNERASICKQAWHHILLHSAHGAQLPVDTVLALACPASLS